jgi:hypothetical protein
LDRIEFSKSRGLFDRNIVECQCRCGNNKILYHSERQRRLLKIVNHQRGHFSIYFLGRILKLATVPAGECFEAFKRADLDGSLLLL